MRRSLPAFVVLLALLGCRGSSEPAKGSGVRLVVFVVVDQLRGDAIARYEPLFTGGFRYLLDRGVYFSDARYGHAPAKTAPGHATLVTGMHPRRHGIVSNEWIDRGSGELVYCIGEDDDRSADALEVDTLGDWLRRANPRGRVVAASGKDRSAVLLGGHDPTVVLWFDDDDGRFRSVPHYGPEPRWVEAFNGLDFPARSFGVPWVPLPISSLERERMRLWQPDEGVFPRGFPHALGGGSPAPDPEYYRDLYASPLGDVYLRELAEAAVVGEGLGRDGVTDLLALSFSAVDAVGHAYGPDSAEQADTILRLDRTLGELFEMLEREVGAEHLLISLSADHGVVGLPENEAVRQRSLALTGNDALREGAAEIACVQQAGRRLTAELGAEIWLRSGAVFDRRALASTGTSSQEAAERLRDELVGCPTVARVLTRTELLEPSPGEDDPLALALWQGYHPARGTEVVVLRRPFVLTRRGRGTGHGSPYPYDTWVPWLVSGPGVPAGLRVEEPVGIVDVSPTLAALAGLAPPTGLDGEDRSELVGGAR